MVSSINSSLSSTAWTNSTTMQRPSQGRNLFEVADTDGDGSISQTELDAVAAGIAQVTENSIDSEITTWDTDEDGGLSNEELMAMLTTNGFGPPEMQGEDIEAPPPPPPPPEDAVSAYMQEDSEDPFDVADTNEDGIVSADELAAVSVTLEEMSNTTIEAENLISQYGSEEGLDQDQYMAMLASMGLTSQGDMQGPPPPSPPSSEDAIAAYSQFANQDPMSQLLDILSASDEESSSINVTS